jgi:hypothetical protein
MKKTVNRFIAAAVLGIPFIASAAGMDFKGLITFLGTNFIVPASKLVLGAAVVFFLWNIFQVVKNAGDEKELQKFKQKAVWGIVGIAVMVSMWGLVNFLTSSANLDNTTVPYPVLPNGSTGN